MHRTGSPHSGFTSSVRQPTPVPRPRCAVLCCAILGREGSGLAFLDGVFMMTAGRGFLAGAAYISGEVCLGALTSSLEIPPLHARSW